MDLGELEMVNYNIFAKFLRHKFYFLLHKIFYGIPLASNYQIKMNYI